MEGHLGDDLLLHRHNVAVLALEVVPVDVVRGSPDEVVHDRVDVLADVRSGHLDLFKLDLICNRLAYSPLTGNGARVLVLVVGQASHLLVRELKSMVALILSHIVQFLFPAGLTVASRIVLPHFVAGPARLEEE